MKDNDLAEAVCSLTCAVIALGDLIRHQNNNQAEVLREILAQKRDCVTKCDLAEATAEIIKAVGSSIDPEKLRKLSKETEKLEKAVEANQPISGPKPG